MSSASWLRVRSAPRPRMPLEIRSASESAQVRTTGRTCSRRRPWRRTNAFWAPIATISESAVAIPAGRGTIDAQRIPIAVNADSLNNWFLPAMLDLSRTHEARFLVHQEDEEHSAQYLRNGTVLAAVTADPRPVQGCRVVRLGKM